MKNKKQINTDTRPITGMGKITKEQWRHEAQNELLLFDNFILEASIDGNTIYLLRRLRNAVYDTLRSI